MHPHSLWKDKVPFESEGISSDSICYIQGMEAEWSKFTWKYDNSSLLFQLLDSLVRKEMPESNAK